jgi:hypothetical protein
MNEVLLSQIEERIHALSVSEKLWLLERVARRIRESGLHESPGEEDQLAAMASDPEIQRELEKINEEFFSTRADGLGFS